MRTDMREFIRHPTDMPLEYKIEDIVDTHSDFLTNISHGGLSFRACKEIAVGTIIQVRIPIHEPVFEADAVVVWCRENPDDTDGCYDVGVEFLDGKSEFSVRMVEQVAHIEHYRREVKINEGREMTSQEAAAEWITKYARDFPH